MKKLARILTSLLLLSLPASAGTLYQSGTETGSRANPGQGEAGGRSFDDVYFALPGGETHVMIDRVTFGIRRIASGGFLTAVDVELLAASMTLSGTDVVRGPLSSLGFFNLADTAATASVTERITATPNLQLALETTQKPGFGGLWLGMQFSGPNAASNNNGWRITGAPTIGASEDQFGFESNTTPFGTFWFGGSPVADFLVDVEGSLSVIPEPQTWVLGVMGALGLLGWNQRRSLN